jgi:hypothetical protein
MKRFQRVFLICLVFPLLNSLETSNGLEFEKNSKSYISTNPNLANNFIEIRETHEGRQQIVLISVQVPWEKTSGDFVK